MPESKHFSTLSLFNIFFGGAPRGSPQKFIIIIIIITIIIIIICSKRNNRFTNETIYKLLKNILMPKDNSRHVFKN